LGFTLTDLLHVLTIFLSSNETNRRDSNHKLKITYFQNSDKLVLYFSDELNATKAFIHTSNVEELVIFNMSFVNKIILTAEVFIDFWKSVDISSDWIEIAINSKEPWLQFSTPKRTDSEGPLSLQFMIKLDDNHCEHSFVEYFFVPDL
jgi:hypothetical protein